jgi:hypothetical protein
MPMTNPSELLERVLSSSKTPMSPEHAKFVLSLGLSAEQKRRHQALVRRASAGRLSLEQQSELNWLVMVNAMLAIIQSKARRSLKSSKAA